MKNWSRDGDIYTGTVELTFDDGRVVWRGTVEGVAYERDVEYTHTWQHTDPIPIPGKTTLVIEFAGDLVAWEE